MKHRRLLTTVALSLALCAVSCAAPHEHVYAEDWAFDASSHWKQPLCGDISPVKEAHVFESGVCTVCEYADPHATPSESETPSTQPPEESQPPAQNPEQKPEQKPSGGEAQTPEPSEQTPEQKPENPEQKPSGETQTPEEKPEQGDVLFEEPTDETITGIPDSEGLVTYRVRVTVTTDGRYTVTLGSK